MREVSKEVVSDMESGATNIIDGYIHIGKDYVFVFVYVVCKGLAFIIKYICHKIG